MEPLGKDLQGFRTPADALAAGSRGCDCQRLGHRLRAWIVPAANCRNAEGTTLGVFAHRKVCDVPPHEVAIAHKSMPSQEDAHHEGDRPGHIRLT